MEHLLVLEPINIANPADVFGDAIAPRAHAADLVFEVRINGAELTFVLTMDGISYRLVPCRTMRSKHGADTKHDRVINDVVKLLAQTSQLRVTDMLDQLEAAGLDYFGKASNSRTQRLNNLTQILNKESRRPDRRVEHAGRRGLYRLSDAAREPADSQ